MVKKLFFPILGFVTMTLSIAGAIFSCSGYLPIKHNERPDVLFYDNYHDMHAEELSCLDCHHQYENDENILDEAELEDGEFEATCSSCHNQKSKFGTQKAFHQQCIGCHNTLKKDKQKAGPSLCGECHIRG